MWRWVLLLLDLELMLLLVRLNEMGIKLKDMKTWLFVRQQRAGFNISFLWPNTWVWINCLDMSASSWTANWMGPIVTWDSPPPSCQCFSLGLFFIVDGLYSSHVSHTCQQHSMLASVNAFVGGPVFFVVHAENIPKERAEDLSLYISATWWQTNQNETQVISFTYSSLGSECVEFNSCEREFQILVANDFYYCSSKGWQLYCYSFTLDNRTINRCR